MLGISHTPWVLLVLSISLASNLLVYTVADQSSAVKSCEPKSFPKNGSVTPVDFTSTIADLRWLGWGSESDKYVVAITQGVGFMAGGEVLLSQDYGKNWKNLTSDLHGLMEADNDTFSFLRGALVIHQSPGNPEKLFIQGAGVHNWISDDYGGLWHRVESPARTLGYWTQIKMHPRQHDYMLALVKRHACRWEATALDKWCASDLFVSQDFGNTWTNLTENSNGRIASFVDFDWGINLRSWDPEKQAPPDKTIFATAYEDSKHMKGPLPSWDKNVHYVMSDDFFKTPHEKLVSCGNKFDVVARKVYLAVPNNCPFHPDGSKRKLSAEEKVSSSVIMYVSEDEGITFREACIPAGDLDLGYQLRANAFAGAAFLMLNHGSQDVVTSTAPVSNIYSSGANTTLFSLTLGRAFRKNNHVDFTAVEGLPGMFIANTLGLNALEDAAFRWDSDVTDFEKYVQTRVSYNGGAHWNQIKRPQTFNYPRCDSCSKMNVSWECQLHLHGPSSWHSTEGKMPALHTHFSAPGLVMAVGNVGQYLDFAADSTCTFLSRDGGETWEDVMDFANVFEFGDQGGLLVMARHQTHGPTDHIKFSMDEGQCWHRVNLSEAIDISSIRVEPTLSSQVFLVYGQACEKSDWQPTCTHTEQGTAPAGKLYALDFQEILGEDWKVCDDDQYEKWSVPNDERCLLGRNITLTRRKRDSACFNGKGWQRPEGIHEYCECDWIDVECDYGYEWSWGRRACVEMPGVDLNTCPRVRDRSYQISESHLRLLSDDVCANISRVINDTDGRGHSTLPRGRHALPMWAIVVIALLVAVVVIALGAQYLNRRGSSASDGSTGAPSILVAPFAAVGNAFGWAKAKITGSRRSEDEYFQPLSGGNEDFGMDDEQDVHSPVRHP